ncbi:MAG: hypothetical protein ACERJ2_02105 [Filomicrobium sp.]
MSKSQMSEALVVECRQAIGEAVVDLQMTALTRDERIQVDSAVAGALMMQFALLMAESFRGDQGLMLDQLKRQHDNIRDYIQSGFGDFYQK